MCEMRFRRRCPKCKETGTLKEQRKIKNRKYNIGQGYYAICLHCHEYLRYFELYDSVNKVIIAEVPFCEYFGVRWKEGFRVIERTDAS